MIISIVKSFSGAETWMLRKVDQKYLEPFKSGAELGWS